MTGIGERASLERDIRTKRGTLSPRGLWAAIVSPWSGIEGAPR